MQSWKISGFQNPGILFFALIVCFSALPRAEAFEVGDFSIGGAMRANYVLGDYSESGGDGPERGANGGNFELDTFRVNIDYDREPFYGKAEYRFYNGYNFIHTLFGGYRLDDWNRMELGVHRVPFGVGAYGPANSWFFDQHYYVGLSDDMDLGIRWRRETENLKIHAAYYPQAEPEGRGDSGQSARYSYDIVDEGAGYALYEEKNQLNLRVLGDLEENWNLPVEVGFSAQWGQLESGSSRAEDSEAVAGSIHAKCRFGAATLMLQYTGYEYDVDYLPDSGLNDGLVSMGAYDFAWPVAAKGTIPSVALSYTWKPAEIEWLDSVTFYNDWSRIVKDGEWDGEDFNDSTLNVTGMAIANEGWYIYVDYAWSDGNYFVGNEGFDWSRIDGVNDFGVNGLSEWNGRFNINFGYYF